MKKVLVFILVIMVILSMSVIAVAESDYASMSTEELLTMRAEIDAELLTRPDAGKAIPCGTYVVGEDIDIGSYVITVTKKNLIAGYVIYDAEGNVVENYYINEGDSIRFSLKEGQTLELTNSNYLIAKAEKISF